MKFSLEKVKSKLKKCLFGQLYCKPGLKISEN